MATETKTSTTTVNSVLQQLRVFRGNCGMEIEAITEAVADIPCDFELENHLNDVFEFVINGVGKGFSLDFHYKGRLLRQYVYTLIFSQTGITSFGPSPSQPPLVTDDLPEGTRCRLTLTRDHDCPSDYANAYLKKLGWSTAETLNEDDMQSTVYGCYASDDGSFGLERKLRTSRSASMPMATSYRKDRS